MTSLLSDLAPHMIFFMVITALVAGFVKGAVGFALPMIMISVLGSFLSPEIALATLIVPTVLANLLQASRGGLTGARAALRDFWLYIVMLLALILVSARLVILLPDRVIFLILGVPVVLFSLMQLAGWRFHVPPNRRRLADVTLGAASGFVGGISGVWGPLTVAYLTALDTPKKVQVQAIGVIFASGAVMLFAAHLMSGVLTGPRLGLSVAMLVPVMAGMGVGIWVQDRLDQERFRRATLAVLVLAGLNLVRRGLIG